MSNSVNVVGSIFGGEEGGSAAPTRSGTLTGANAAKEAADRQAQQQQDALDKLNPSSRAVASTPLPTPNSDEVLTARRRSIAAQIARRGRASTILTRPGNGDTLGA
jgi:hypothetical protein